MPGNPERSFSNFADLRKAAQLNDDRNDKEEFDRLLKGKFDRVAPGNFISKIPNVESITIAPIQGKNEGDAVEQLFASVFYKNRNGKEASATFSVGPNGEIGGTIPHELQSTGFTKEKLFREILDTARVVNYSFWRMTDMEILPGQDPFVPSEDPQTVERGPVDRRLDPERLQFVEERDDSVYGAVNKRSGFNGYRVVLLRDCIVLENPEVGNAAYVYPLATSIELTEEQWQRPPSDRVTDEEGQELLRRLWGPIAQQVETRKELLAIGASRVIHTEGTWKEKLAEAIAKASERKASQEKTG